jgi:hypothetical protein
MWVCGQPSLAEATVNVLDIAPVKVTVTPFLRQYALGGDVGSGDYVAHTRARLQAGTNRAKIAWVGGHLAIGSRRLEERHLQVAKFFPVDDVGVEVDTERLERLFDVGDSELRVPAVIEVYRKRPQACLLYDPGHVCAIYSAAHTNDAVVCLSGAGSLDLRDQGIESP